MLLEITIVAGLGVAPFPPTELTIMWPCEAQGADDSGVSLRSALDERWPGYNFFVSGEELQYLHAGTAPLVDGAVVVAQPRDAGAGGPGREVSTGFKPAESGAGTAALLCICSGPGAGAVFALHRGQYSLGRGHCRITVSDPALSRHHGTLRVGSHHITLTAIRGSTGFTLRRTLDSPTASAEPIKGTRVLLVGQRVHCGSTEFELRFPDSGLLDPTSMPDGTNALLDPAALEPLVVTSDSGSVRNRVAMIVAGTLPLVLGIGLALLMGSWMFLAFSAMGATAVVIPLIGGSKRRRAFRSAIADATRQDWARRAAAFPDAASLMIATRTSAVEQAEGKPRARPSLDVALRLGIGTASAAIAVSANDSTFIPPEIPSLPITVPLGPRPVTINGPSAPMLKLLNFALMQLDSAQIPVVLFGSADIVPLEARFLPLTVLATSLTAAALALADVSPGTNRVSPGAVLVAINEPVTGLLASVPGLHVLHFALPRPNSLGGSSTTLRSLGTRPRSTEPLGPTGAVAAAPMMALGGSGSASAPDAASVSLEAAGNHITGTFKGSQFVPDGVSSSVFGDYARRRAFQCGGVSDSWGPGEQRSLRANTLPLLERSSVASIVREWGRSSGGQLCPVQLGLAETGPTMFDFLRDGPHLLVGGTTGSGKSEILRTLVGNLAIAHSPADLQFVFIDFKGGAGLGVLVKLPHTTSLITDLSGHGMDRTLASLRAEIRHREAALASVEAADSQGYRAMIGKSGAVQDGHSMAHLIIVVDEFRVLVDQFPDAMAELMRIAAVGRSLGIHLVLATQRPQGAVNADIRANVTSSICLRVQSVFDSTDVIGTGVAASISVGTPGRAFISRAGAIPEEFQSATLRLPDVAHGGLPTVELATARLARVPTSGTDTGAGLRQSDVAAVAKLLTEAWQVVQARGPERNAPCVVADELPSEVEIPINTPATSTNDDGAGCEVVLGIVDVPQSQSLHTLRWNPLGHSHLAFFGTQSETSTATELVVGQLLTANAEQERMCPHLLYLLDGNGSLQASSSSEFVGAYITPQNLRTAAHLVQKLAETARSHPESMLVLCISDWGRWATALRSSPWHQAEDGIAELIRFGHQNLVVVIGGARELVTAPFLSSIPNRIYLTHGSSAESTMLWPRLPQFDPVPGRASIAGPLNTHSAAHQIGTEDLHIAQLARPAHTTIDPTSMAGRQAEGILHVSPLPRTLTLAQLHVAMSRNSRRSTGEGLQPVGGRGPSILLGIGGDGGQAVEIAVVPGSVLPVVGSPGCGKSDYLRALELLNGEMLLNGEANPTRILYLDDAATLPPAKIQEATQHLSQGAVIVAAFPYPGPSLSALPAEWGLRNPQQGIVLAPQRPGDAELFGVRLDTVGAEPPGRAVLLNRGRSTWFQCPQAD
ncbi:FtsK/SpoIIIE domain-containing protein [Arthrobacter sp. TWP1-1]|uniref:FtsK/SpoIIIE domain-containing protein n=1 Tax=Arthrobacter sp. TWP1-1 TaxID=2804568 RepID=UPI003CEB880C